MQELPVMDNSAIVMVTQFYQSEATLRTYAVTENSKWSALVQGYVRRHNSRRLVHNNMGSYLACIGWKLMKVCSVSIVHVYSAMPCKNGMYKHIGGGGALGHVSLWVWEKIYSAYNLLHHYIVACQTKG